MAARDQATIQWDNATNKLPGRIHIFNRVMPVKDSAPKKRENIFLP
jgi:hypothetical protein